MSDQLYLSRARLRAGRGEALSAIAPLLLPDDTRHQAGHAHRILWLLFQDTPDSKRDFLWRDEGGGKYMILSPRPPSDPLGLFELDSKPFAPALEAGDALSFALRANPVVASKPARTLQRLEKGGPRTRGQKVDVVMHALKDVPKGARGTVRDEVAAQAGTAWLTSQGGKSGFRLAAPPLVDGYAQVPVERRKGRPAGFSVLNFAGRIEITDPAAFLAKLASGFGSAKAFGNGLMMIRRA
ncbi:MAG: type I-E CRISPR-associated protein Cas6/Cse3/CasE [Hyphomicrobiaceae bacterium]